MKKNVKVITINGFRGLVFAVFIIFGLISGFIVTPSFICMHGWNYIADNFINIPRMELYHGAMLWTIIGLSIFALCKDKIFIGVPIYPKFDEEQINSIINSEMKKNMPAEFIDTLDVKNSKNENEHEEIKR